MKPWLALHCCHRLLRCLVVALMALGPSLTSAAQAGPLVLHDELNEISAWPAVRILKDESGRLSAQQAWAARTQFTVPDSPHANLGPQRGAVWLYLPLRVPPDQSGQWLLEVDYAGLQRIDAVQISGDRMTAPVMLGTFTLRANRPTPSRTPVLPLALEPGRDHAVLMRIESTGAFVLPIRLLRPMAYKETEEQAQAFQGLIAGLELFLLLYSLTQWAVLRDPMYLDYAVANVGLTLVFLAYYGMGSQHLWPHSEWLTRNAAPAGVFIGMIGIFHFVERWLRSVGAHPYLLTVLRIGAAAAAVCLVAFVAGLIEYRSAQLLASIMGPVPVLAGLPTAYRRARAGSVQAKYMFLGWGCYGLGAITLTALVRGLAPANLWTQHAFQIASLAEMTLFMGVLGMRVQEMRVAAAQAQREHATLQALAHTDPLTGLLNRRGMDLALEAALHGVTPDSLTAVFLLDLDGFKPINDRLGHDVGDALLVAVGARLKSLLRSGDVVARLGGDEFVVVVSALPGCDEAAKVGEKLLESFAVPISTKGHACRVGLTIGYALAPLDGFDAASLLRRADAAMYAGKQAGRNCVQRGAATAGLAGLHAPVEARVES